ncbi:MAG: ABC transporter permease [Catenulispora sp. 13_1_20CM_3_70_7]|nr:MAG: ABC transporter permease [Catenulispora sp. 13_1_20CM_3_70_7]
MIFGYLSDHRTEITTWLGYHAWLSALPVVLGLLISLPLGWLACRYRWLYGPLVTIAGLTYTIPSIALFVVLPGLIGTKVLDPANVAIALTIYTVALLVRVVADGLSAVPDDVAQAATAMGFRRLQRVISVELPIALSTIGVPELGQLFTNGFQLSYFTPIILGIVLCVLLALAFDTLIVLAARALTPWRRAVKPS